MTKNDINGRLIDKEWRSLDQKAVNALIREKIDSMEEKWYVFGGLVMFPPGRREGKYTTGHCTVTQFKNRIDQLLEEVRKSGNFTKAHFTDGEFIALLIDRIPTSDQIIVFQEKVMKLLLDRIHPTDIEKVLGAKAEIRANPNKAATQ